MAEKLTYRQAAARVRRSVRAIHYWRQNGMPMGWELREGQHVRVVDEDVLLSWWRDRLKNDPAHRWRMRRRTTETQTPDDTTRPESQNAC